MRFFIIVNSLIVLLITGGCDEKKTVIPLPSNLGIQISINANYKVESNRLNQTKAAGGGSFIARADRDVIMIQSFFDMASLQAAKMIADEKLLIESVFREQPVPYPGFLSTLIGCPEGSRPRMQEEKKTDSWRVAYELFANKRYGYGSCLKEMNDFNMVYVLLYCPVSRKFHKIKFFTPINAPSMKAEGFLSALTCR